MELYIGAKIPRKVPAEGDWLDVLDEQARLNEPECDIFIHCSWRLDGPAGTIASSGELDEHEDPRVRNLLGLIGETIENVDLFLPVGDMNLRFSNGKILKVFCDATTLCDNPSNWAVIGPKPLLVIAKGGNVRVVSN